MRESVGLMLLRTPTAKLRCSVQEGLPVVHPGRFSSTSEALVAKEGSLLPARMDCSSLGKKLLDPGTDLEERA
jgi:hypothetical protein